jgi:hypothetical protein
MLSVARLDSNNVVVRASKLYLVTVVAVGTDCHINIGEMVPDESKGRYAGVTKEVWGSRAMALHPQPMLHDVVADFVNCRDLDIPVELVYEWGGVINHRVIAINSSYRSSLQ